MKMIIVKYKMIFLIHLKYLKCLNQLVRFIKPGSGNTPIDIEQLRKNNPQTELLCLMLGIRNPIDVILNRKIQPIQFDQTD